MLLEFFVNNLISGVPTHVTYVVGGQMLLLNKMGPETAAAAAPAEGVVLATADARRL